MKVTEYGFAVIEGDTHLGRWCIEHKRLDFDQNALPQILPFIKPEHTVINVGANIGCYAYPIAQIAKEVICFEPNPEAFECLKHNIGGLLNVHLFNLAISNESGKVNLVKSENAGASYVTPDPQGSIETRTIDGFNIPKVDVLFVDCEGFEYNMLLGAAKTIRKDKPIIFLEINRGALQRAGATPNDIFIFLESFGYSYRNIYEGQPMEGEQYDIVCW